MSRPILQEIISDFEITRFNQFFRSKTSILGNFRPSEESLTQYNDDNFSRVAKIGQIEFSSTQKLLIISANSITDLSERSGKKAQYEKAKKILKELSVYTGCIIIFYDQKGDFRFSLVYDIPQGRRREWSLFRRYTYFVSKTLSNKTFLQRIGEGDFSSFDGIKDAFSVEKVTREFYEEYRHRFESLLANLNSSRVFTIVAEKNRINSEDFAKKLLGQIVFLYFVQKKGWLGVKKSGKWSEGDRNFMSNLFKRAVREDKNYYNDFLEPLFYETLNNSRRGGADPSFSKYFDCRIPFLNGGLFDPDYDWKDSSINLDNAVFKDIYDTFDRFNFTIEEESPEDKEVAIDPEMLGKVFENLLLENLRRGKGTYYTPREIVQYMCGESLKSYLFSNMRIKDKNHARLERGIDGLISGELFVKDEDLETLKSDEELEKTAEKIFIFTKDEATQINELLCAIKIVDPACGSGAFLVGMLRLVVDARIFLNQWYLKDKKSSYQLKKETIQNCVYGVDIDPGAVDIAKLRLYLSLVVEHNFDDIEPLPNLDYRIMCGNSLLEEYEGIKFYNGETESQATLLPEEPEKHKKIIELKKKTREYFELYDISEKRKKRDEINKLKDWLIKTALEAKKKRILEYKKEEERKANMLDKKSREHYLSSFGDWLKSDTKIQEALDSFHNPKASKPFFIWRLEFVDVFETGGFDVVIANPPYISAWSMEKSDPSSREEIKKALAAYPILVGHWDLYIAFIAKGHQLIKGGGVLSYIMPNPVLREKYATETRKFLLTQMHISSLLEFSDTNVFEGVARRTTVLIAKKAPEKQNYEIAIHGNQQENIIGLIKSTTRDAWLNQPRHSFLIDGNNAEDVLVKKIESTSDKIGNFFYVNYGAQVSSKEKGGFGKKDVVSKKSKGNAKRYYEGKDIKRWKLANRDMWLDYKVDEMYGPRDPKLFEQNKIAIRMVSDKGHKIAATLDTTKKYSNHSVVLIAPYEPLEKSSLRTDFEGFAHKKADLDLRYVLAILLSKLESFYFKNRFATESLQGSTSHTYPASVRALVIKNISRKEQEPFVKLVDRIFEITGSSEQITSENKEKIHILEKEIDERVYKLFGLTPEDIELIES